MRVLLQNSQPILTALQAQIDRLSVQLQSAVGAEPPRGLGKMTSVIIDREIGEYSSGGKRLQGCVTKHGNPRLRAALVELAWRMVRFQPRYRAVRRWKDCLKKGHLTTGAARKKAIVALARQLAVDLWRIRTGRLTPEQLGLEI